jgi:diguanylate cyclase (GGDEF)-like protein
LNWRFSSYSVAYLFTIGLSLVVAYISWRKRETPGSLPLALFMLAVAEWSFAAALEAAAGGIPAKVILSKIEYLGIVSSPILYLLFALQYSRQNKWLTRRNIVILWVLPVVTLAIAVTNDWHKLLWTSFAPVLRGEIILIFTHGIWFWVLVAYAYLSILVGVLSLVLAAIRFPFLFLRPVRALIVGSILLLLGNIIYVSNLSPVPRLDWTPIMFAVAGMILAWGIFRRQVFDLIPVARDALVEGMSDGIIVLDTQEHIVDINLVAQQLLGLAADTAMGKDAGMIFSAWPDVLPSLRSCSDARIEIQLGKNKQRHLDLRIVPLKGGDPLAGHLVVLRDISNYKQAVFAESEQRILAEAMRDTASALNSTLNFDEVLDRILANVKRVVPHEFATIMLVNEGGEVTIARSRGYRKRGKNLLVHSLRLRVDDVPNLRKMMDTGNAIVISDTRTDDSWIKIKGLHMLVSYVGAPIKVRNETVGFLNLESSKPHYFSPMHAGRLQILANQAAIAIGNAQLYRSAQDEILERVQAEKSLREAHERMQRYVNQIEKLQAELREQVICDPLTGLFNQRYLKEALEIETSRALRSKMPMGIIMLDLDHFKHVNDNYGHEAGNAVLQALGKFLQSHIREDDLICRYGGDEFLVILPGTTLESALQRAEQMREGVQSVRVNYRGKLLDPITLSLGIAVFPDHGTTGARVIQAADAAMYRAKRAGRNQVQVASPGRKK